MLTSYQRMAYRLFGGPAASGVASNPHLRRSLQRAHIYLRPEVYLSSVYLTMVIALGVAFLPLLLVVAGVVAGVTDIPPRILAFLVPAPLVLTASIYLLALVIPDLRAVSRAREIDAKLPYALNFVTAMSSAGATPGQVFSSLARQPVYGAVAYEAAWISRDLELLGTDIVTALSRAIDRSPSARFQDLLQGAITTLTSGGSLKGYFQVKSEQFLYENRQDQRKFLEGLGVLAESFVTVVVAGPLFIIVILSVMTSLGSSAAQTLALGYILVFALIPLSQLGFAWTVKVMTPEA